MEILVNSIIFEYSTIIVSLHISDISMPMIAE